MRPPVLCPHTSRSGLRALLLVALCATAAPAQTFGEALIARPEVLVATRQLAISTTPFGVESFGKSLTSFSVFGGRSTSGGGSNVGRIVTPLLVTLPTSPSFVTSVVGVGTSREVGDGINTWDFALTSGSSVIDETVRFAWLSFGGDAVHYSPSGGPLVWFNDAFAPISTVPAPGDEVAITFGSTWAFSIQWTVGDATPTPVPEPSSASLLLVAGAALAARRGRRLA